MVDLDPLMTLLAGLGPWGLLIGAGITLGLQWLAKRRNPTPVDPDKPTDPTAPKRPILDALMEFLRLFLEKKSAAPKVQFGEAPKPQMDADGEDLDEEKVKKLLGVLFDLKK